MSDPIAYLNGEFVPQHAMQISVTDAGFVQGLTCGEQLRTFRGKLFRIEHHLKRLHRSLQIVGLQNATRLDGLVDIGQQLIAHNRALLSDEDDLGLSIFVTPGTYPTFAGSGSTGPTIGLHTYPLPFGNWSSRYKSGQDMVVSSVRQVPENCWPAELKCRSRMHYYLADREARERVAGARALLLDQAGYVVEASTANTLMYRSEEGLISPPRDGILPGISVAFVQELAAELGIPFVERAILPEQIVDADEFLLCSTSPCILPVCHLDEQPIGGGLPGAVFGRLLQAWSDRVGIDIADQAIRFASR